MPTGLVRRTLLTGMRGFPNRDWVLSPPMPAEVGWTRILPHQPILTEVLGEAGIETAYVTDNPFLIGPRYIDFRRTLDIARPDFSQGAYRAGNLPFKRPAPRSAIEKYLLPALSDTIEVRRLQDHVGWASLYRVGERNYSAARVIRSGMAALEELKDKQPFFLGVDSFDPHEPFDAPPRVREPDGARPEAGDPEDGRDPADPAVPDAGLEAGQDRHRSRDARARARPLRRRADVRRPLDRQAAEQARRPRPRRQHSRLLPLRPRRDAWRARHHRQVDAAALPRDPSRAVHDPRPLRAPRGPDERLLRLHARRRAHDPVVLRRARARADGGRGPFGDLRRQAADRTALLHRLLPGDVDLRRPQLAADLRHRGPQARAVRPDGRPGRRPSTSPRRTSRWSRRCGRCSSTRPAARCRSSRRTSGWWAADGSSAGRDCRAGADAACADRSRRRRSRARGTRGRAGPVGRGCRCDRWRGRRRAPQRRADRRRPPARGCGQGLRRRLRRPSHRHAEHRRAVGRLAALQVRGAGRDAGDRDAARPAHRDALLPVPRLAGACRRACDPGLGQDLRLPAAAARADRRARRQDGLRDGQSDAFRAAVLIRAAYRHRHAAELHQLHLR